MSVCVRATLVSALSRLLPALRPFIDQGRIHLDFRIAKEVILADEVTVEDLQLDCRVLLRQQTGDIKHIQQCNIT